MTRVASLAALLSLAAGCLAHERAVDLDAGIDDAATIDTTTLAQRDAGCLVQCPAATVLARAPIETTGSLLGIVASDDGVVFALALIDPGSGDSAMVPTIYRIDETASDHALRTLPAPATVRAHEILQGGGLRLVGDELRAVMLQNAPPNVPEWSVAVGTVTWSTAGDLRSEHDVMAVTPFTLSFGAAAAGTAFGTANRDLVAFADGSVVHAFVLDGTGATPPLVDLVDLADSGTLLALSGVMLEDGSVIVAGGGVTRAAFLAIGPLGGGPLTARAVVGQSYDPSPVVVREPGGFALVRHVSDATDLARSALHVQHHTLDGTLVRESIVATEDGRRPQVTTAFESDAGVGVAWTEQSDADPDASYLRVLVPGADASCPALAALPVARLDTLVSSIAATTDSRGEVVVAVVTQSLVPPEPISLTFYRVTGCSIAR